MKSAIFAALALLSGCGFHDYAYSYPQPQPRVIPGTQPGISAFVVDDGAGAVADPNTYAITTQNGTWRLAWIGDAYQHHFSGTLYGATGGTFLYAKYASTYPSANVQVTGDQATFDAVTTGSTIEILDLDVTTEPITYDLYIDGQPAIGAVVFQSRGVPSTTDTMPFALYSSTSGLSKDGKAQLAPQFISQLVGDRTTQAVTVPAPVPGSNAASISGVTLQSGALQK
jgi:hypothetical protein